MKQMRFVSQFLATGILFLGLGTMGGVVAQAQNFSCVGTGGYYGTMNENVSVGRKFYTSFWYMRPNSYNDPASITCRLPLSGTPPKPQTLELQFGIPENKDGSYLVTVWLDGNQVISESITRGEVKTLILDVKYSQNLAIETRCAGNTDCGNWENRLRFFKSDLKPVLPPPTPPTPPTPAAKEVK